MSLVNVHNEWDPLEEIIVGIVDNAQVPLGDKGLFTIRYHKFHDSIQDIPSGPYKRHIIEETQEDLEALVQTLEKLNIVVRRPKVSDHAKVYASPDWQANGEYNYCPRDLLLLISHPGPKSAILNPCSMPPMFYVPGVIYFTLFPAPGICWGISGYSRF